MLWLHENLWVLTHAVMQVRQPSILTRQATRTTVCKCICIYKCVDVHVCEIAVTWAIYRKIAHSRVRENFTRPHLCHSPITICPPMTLALWVGRIMDKFARFMGEFWHNSPDFWAIFQYLPYGVRISKISRWLLWEFRPHLCANRQDWGDLISSAHLWANRPVTR